MTIKEKEYYGKDFDEKLKEVRSLEAQLHHQNEMYRRPLQNKRKDIIFSFIEKKVSGKTFLDVGCAEGLFNQHAHDKGATNSVGVDISKTKIETAKAQYPSCSFFIRDIKNINLEDNYDIVLCSEVLQHLVDYDKCISEMVEILTDKGELIISIPNLSATAGHEFADITPNLNPEELLSEIGGAGFGKQNAIWKFNTKKFSEELRIKYNLSLVDYVPVDAKPLPSQTEEQASNIFTIIIFKKKVD